MKRAAVFSMALAMLCWATTFAAQQHPGFSGKWTLDTSMGDMGASGGGGGMSGRGGGRGGGMGWGQEFTITQDAATLKIERVVGGNPMTETYKLDGSESKNSEAMGRGGNVDVISTAKWDGSKLVIESKQEMNMGGNAMTMATTRTLSLDASGHLVVETTRSGMQGSAMTTKMVYKKGHP